MQPCPDQAALEAIVAPLAEVCAALGFTYSWRVRRDGDQWAATCAAGFPRVNGRLTGPHPCYGVTGVDAEAALARAAGWALDHARGYPNGYTPPAPPPWMK